MMNYYKINSLNWPNNDPTQHNNVKSQLETKIDGSALELFDDAVNAYCIELVHEKHGIL